MYEEVKKALERHSEPIYEADELITIKIPQISSSSKEPPITPTRIDLSQETFS